MTSLVSRLFRVACGTAGFSTTQQYTYVRDGKNNSSIAAYVMCCKQISLPKIALSQGFLFSMRPKA